MRSVSITSKVASWNPADGEVYSIQHYVIGLVSDLRQVCRFLQVLQFPLQIKLTATYLTEILLKVTLNTITLTLTLQKCVYIYSPTKVKHHLICFNNIFSNNELISNRFAVLVTCTHILTYLWNRLLIDFYLCVYDRVCTVPRVLFNICVCERKLIFCV